MKLFTRFLICLSLITTMAIASLTSESWGDDKKKKTDSRLNRISRSNEAQPGFDQVEMYSALEKGEIKVRFIPSSATKAKLILENATDRPLSIQMPATFSAVPAMRQIMQGGGGGGGGMPGGGGQGGGMGGMGGGGMQGMGGGMGGGGMGGMGGGGMGGMGGGGMFNIPANKTGRFDLNTVCLEEGKVDPNSKVEYVLQPLEKLNSDPRVAEICVMLGNGEITTQVAQAAAWHVTDNKSWEFLATKNRRESMDGTFERFFHPNEVRMAAQVVALAKERAETRARLLEQEKKAQEGSSKEAYSQTSAAK